MFAAISDDFGLVFHSDKSWLLRESGCDVCSGGIFLDGQSACDSFDCDSGNPSTVCRISTTRAINLDLRIAGNGSFVLEASGAITCAKLGCQIQISMVSNVSIVGSMRASDISVTTSSTCVISGSISVSASAPPNVTGSGSDCCGTGCNFNQTAGGGGGGHGGPGGGCCLNGFGAGSDSDNITAPWAFGGAGGRGSISNVSLISSGTCASLGLGAITDAGSCRTAAAGYFGIGGYSWGGQLDNWNYYTGCVITGSTVYFYSAYQGYISSAYPCSSSALCLCGIGNQNAAAIGGAGGGRVSLIAAESLVIYSDGVVEADGGAGGDCTSVSQDLTAFVLTSGTCGGGAVVTVAESCQTAAARLLGVGYTWVGSVSSPQYPPGCVALGSTVYLNTNLGQLVSVTVAAGSCPGAGQIQDYSTCAAAAGQLGQSFGGINWQQRSPSGCVLTAGGGVYFNSNQQFPAVACSETYRCVCGTFAAPAPCSTAYQCLCGSQGACGGGGGGAGGSIQLEARAVDGSGTVRANGGAGGANGGVLVSGAGGGGGGGRIAVRYGSSLSAELAMEARGGQCHLGCARSGAGGSIVSIGADGATDIMINSPSLTVDLFTTAARIDCDALGPARVLSVGTQTQLTISGRCAFQEVLLLDKAAATSRGALSLAVAGPLALGAGASLAAAGELRVTVGSAAILGGGATVVSSVGILIAVGGSLAIGSAATLRAGSNLTITAGAGLILGENASLQSGGNLHAAVRASLALGPGAELTAGFLQQSDSGQGNGTFPPAKLTNVPGVNSRGVLVVEAGRNVEVGAGGRIAATKSIRVVAAGSATICGLEAGKCTYCCQEYIPSYVPITSHWPTVPHTPEFLIQL